MSKFTERSKKRVEQLTDYMLGLINGENGKELIDRYNITVENFIPSDILAVFDNLFNQKIDIEEVKTASNKLFNILFKTLNEYPEYALSKESYLYYLKIDNDRIKAYLNEIKPDIKRINHSLNKDALISLKEKFRDLLKINIHYVTKENILFPFLEKNYENSDCLKLMWSFHDDIRSNIKNCIHILLQKPC